MAGNVQPKFEGPVKPGERRNPYGKKGKPKPQEPDGLTDGGRMRRVYEQAADADANEAQRRLRSMMSANFPAYYKLMLELEREERGLSAAGGVEPAAAPAAELPPDEAEERVLRLCEDLLRRASEAARARRSGAAS